MPGSWQPNDLPNLNAQNHSITSPVARRYNCIAWAAGNDSLWWWPVGPYYWPPGVPKQETIAAFILAYGTMGYTPCRDGTLEVGIEKVAIYAVIGPTGQPTPTHAARQLPNGKWTSKLGTLEDIEHATSNCVDCPRYGTVVQFMGRPRQAP
jgi:hypothetical protein